jgi:hypothetical protein
MYVSLEMKVEDDMFVLWAVKEEDNTWKEESWCTLSFQR